ncbi:MAG TPA: FAD:protein FMN transferase, partial [Rhodothermales bacterium]
EPRELEAARSVTGMHLVRLDRERRTISFERPGVMIDLGGIGKGYAVDEAIGILREAGVERAFLHGGTSTSYGLGTPPDGLAWNVSIDAPADVADADASLAVADLRDASLSVSAVWGKAFTFGGREYGHVIDPRLGEPVEGAVLTAVVCESATEADALSTALLVEGRRSAALLERMRDRCRALLLFPSSDSSHYEGIEAGLSFVPSPNLRISTAP